MTKREQTMWNVMATVTVITAIVVPVLILVWTRLGQHL